jgi:hypothetical protein
VALMSVRIMALVWDFLPSGGSDLLAMLALADWSDDEGRCWPSMSSIAEKTRLSRSQAQRVVHGLISSGFLEVIGNEGGGKPGATRQYRINLRALTGRTDATRTGRTDATGSVDATGSADAQDGSHGCDGRGRTDATLTISEPPRTVSTREQAPDVSPKKGSERQKTLKTFLEACTAAGVKPIGDDDPIFDYARKVGIDYEMLTVAWREFKAVYLVSNKLQKDWPQHFRNAVRRNWYGLWFLKEGEDAHWTTAGEQARRAAA